MQHDLVPHFPALARFKSSAELHQSELYAPLKPEVERVLGSIASEHLAPEPPAAKPFVRATAWNIERGSRLDGIVRVLAEHPVIRTSDVFLLTELDHGMARSDNRIVARELARRLQLNYVFVPCYLSLVKGSGLEYHVEGENALGLHGNAVFSRYPLRDPVSIALRNGKDLMAGKEKRLGEQRVAVATVDHPSGPVRVAAVHLDAHSSRRHRAEQMRQVLDAIDARPDRLPVILGGDWNTSTYNSDRAARAILGFWRRVLMGVDHVVRNHYPHPDRKFERALFAALEERGYRYRDVNELGVGTLHYDVSNLSLNTNLGDWIPDWCFPFISWAMAKVGGRCSLKLDWFAVRDLAPWPQSKPRVLADVHDRAAPLSDHDPIVVDLVPAPAGA